MMKRYKVWFMVIAALGCLLSWQGIAFGQEEVAAGIEVAEGADAGTADGDGFFTVIKSGGVVGIILWLALLATSMICCALIFDSFMNVKESKVIPIAFVEKIQAAMEQGDIMKAQELCKEEPGPMSNILGSAFDNVEDGFEAIQDAVTVIADMETERLMQRVNYLNVIGNLAPMLGLLGTVQGMIFAFATLASAGAAAASLLAMNISQALYTTAAGLIIAVPALAFFYVFKNRASNIILKMEQITLDEIKILRHVEVE